MDRWLALLLPVSPGSLSSEPIADDEVIVALPSASRDSNPSPLPLPPSVAQQDKASAISLLILILHEIEFVPIRVDDMRVLRSAVSSFMKQHSLHDERDLVRAYQFRFSLEYLPGASQIEWWRFSKHVSAKPPSAEELPRPLSAPRSLSPARIVTSPKVVDRVAADKCYMLCSIKRQQQTLLTTYKLFLDGTRDFLPDGQLSEPTLLDPPMFLLGTKVSKGGSSVCLVWQLADAKLWKDKNSSGRIVRSNGVLFGSPDPAHVPSATLSGSLPGSTATSAPSTLPSGTSPLPSPAPISASGAGSVPEADAADEGPLSSRKSVNTAELPLEGGPVAVSVQRRGMEKLLHLTAALPIADNGVPSSSYPEGALEEALRSPNIEELQLRGLRLLRSRPPRRVTGSQGMMVAFGKDTRVKTVSRKNVVLDLAQTTDWAAGGDQAPIFQFGKMGEDAFAVDFRGISPFQAFTIALAAFDR